MRTFRFVAVQALTVAGILSLPVFAQQTQPLQTPEESQAQVAPATPVKEPVTEAVQEPVTGAVKEPVKEPVKVAVKEPEKKPVAPASTQLQVKVGDASIRFGILMQPQADFQQNSAGGYGQNLLIRRARFLIGGQVTKSVFFFYETENSRLGAATATGTKTTNTGFQTLDAAVEWRPRRHSTFPAVSFAFRPHAMPWKALHLSSPSTSTPTPSWPPRASSEPVDVTRA